MPEVSDQDARAVIHEQFPALIHHPVRRLGAGTDHVAFDVGSVYVFRFPRHGRAAAALVVEAELTEWLAPRLPLPVPVRLFAGQASERFPYAFAGYQKLQGTPALHLDLNRQQAAIVARCIGGFLRELHALELDLPARLSLSAEDDSPDEWSRDALADLHFAFEHGLLGVSDVARWREVLASPPPAIIGGPDCLLHGDFAAEHVLISTRGDVSGVIDWSDARLGDPALDLAGVFHWGGLPWLHAVLEEYGAVDRSLAERARWHAACRAVADLAFGLVHGRPEYLRAGKRALAWTAE